MMLLNSQDFYEVPLPEVQPGTLQLYSLIAWRETKEH